MNQETLMKFIQRIIVTSRQYSQSALALEELEGILKKQGASREDLELIALARQGVEDSEGSMKSSLADVPVLFPNELKTAATRAHEMKIRIEEARRNGRC